jgi:hypothetical protein
VAHTFEELVSKQHTADAAHAHVLELRKQYGPPTQDGGWSVEQTETYDTAWKGWRERAQEVQAAVTTYAKDEGRPRYEVEADVKKKARHPAPETAAA